MESPSVVRAPIPDGDSPCQIFLDRLEDLGIQIDTLLRSVEEVDRQYQACLSRQPSPELKAAHRRFETLRRIATAARKAMPK